MLTGHSIVAEPQHRQERIFVVGGQRSGTTMLRLMLNSHPHIAIPFESDFIPRFYRRVADYGDLGRKENVVHLLDDIAEQPFVKRGKLVRDKAAILARRPQSYPDLIRAIYQVYAESEGKRRWGERTRLRDGARRAMEALSGLPDHAYRAGWKGRCHLAARAGLGLKEPAQAGEELELAGDSWSQDG